MIKSKMMGLLLSTLCLTIGCGDGGASDLVLKRRSNLEVLGAAYLGYHQAHGKSTAGASELADFMKPSASDPKTADAITALTEGDVVIIFAGQLGAADENAKHVLGFEAGVPATGGYVVMGDGKVRLMTIKDFSEASLIPVSGSDG
jgi:hypothetical protein